MIVPNSFRLNSQRRLSTSDARMRDLAERRAGPSERTLSLERDAALSSG